MKTATLLFQNRPHYRVDAFTRGLKRAGYEVQHTTRKQPEPGDVLVIWNRMRGRGHTLAEQWERAGADVLVVENGYIGRDERGGKLFAMACNHHLGRGEWRVGDADRWQSHGIELRPWRQYGERVVMLPQRGIGEHGIAMPGAWVTDAMQRLKRLTDRPIHIRRHPGAVKHEPYNDFDNCHCVVTWASGAAIKAICYGIPAVYGLDGWIASPAALALSEVERKHGNLENLLTCDGARVRMLERLAWAQWSIAEIETGFAFDWIMGGYGGVV